MCGIMGYSGPRPAIDVLIRGLRRLEYRGYDSTGVAFELDGKIEIRKSEGKLTAVEKLIGAETERVSKSHFGIGHTRWATHGAPTTANAHPHQTGHVVLVANGIIENYQEIREELISKGHHPLSETDSELFGFLVLDEMDTGRSLRESVRRAFLRIRGACSVVVISEREPGVIVGARNGSPLVVGKDPQGGVIFASDAQPILDYQREVYFIEHGVMVEGSQDELSFIQIESGEKVSCSSVTLDWTPEKLDKQGYEHYMLKEINEQPLTFVDTMNSILDRTVQDPFRMADQPAVKLIEKAKNITIVACGTSLHAAMLGKYWIEKLARIAVNVEVASEFRYRQPMIAPDSLVVGVSQSGETADTLAVIQDAKKQGFKTLAITNVRGSTISREADAAFFTASGPELSVAATKTFTAQMLMLFVFAGFLATRRQTLLPSQIQVHFDELIRLPHLVGELLENDSLYTRSIVQAAKKLHSKKGFFFIGRGFSFPVALEGALKLKEIAYVHAEGYAAGELKHGPIAMIDGEMVVVVLAPNDHWRDKTVSNLEEVKARGAKILGVGDSRDLTLQKLCDEWVPLPEVNEMLVPFVLAPVIQRLSYEIALMKGTDVDKPRNLAKSVTVE